MMRLLLIIILCLVSSAQIVPSAQASQKTASEIGPEVGRYAPPLQLNDLSGSLVSLDALKGSVVLLNFWSSQCGRCMAEMPSLNRLYASLNGKGLQVISVAVDNADAAIRDYVAKNNISFPVLFDPDGNIFERAYSRPSLPATYLIDRTGMIVEKFSGLEVWDAPEMKNRVLMLIEKQ